LLADCCSSTLRERKRDRENPRSKNTKGITRPWKLKKYSNRWRLARCGMKLAAEMARRSEREDVRVRWMFIYSETKADGKSRIRDRRDFAVAEPSAVRTITSVYVSSGNIVSIVRGRDTRVSLAESRLSRGKSCLCGCKLCHYLTKTPVPVHRPRRRC